MIDINIKVLGGEYLIGGCNSSGKSTSGSQTDNSADSGGCLEKMKNLLIDRDFAFDERDGCSFLISCVKVLDGEYLVEGDCDYNKCSKCHFKDKLDNEHFILLYTYKGQKVVELLIGYEILYIDDFYDKIISKYTIKDGDISNENSDWHMFFCDNKCGMCYFKEEYTVFSATFQENREEFRFFEEIAYKTKPFYEYNYINGYESASEDVVSALIIDKKNNERYVMHGFYSNDILNGLTIYHIKKGGQC